MPVRVVRAGVRAVDIRMGRDRGGGGKNVLGEGKVGDVENRGWGGGLLRPIWESWGGGIPAVIMSGALCISVLV